MSSQKFFKKLEKNTKDLNDFILLVGGGKESILMYNFFKENDFEFEPILIVFDEYTRSIEKIWKGKARIIRFEEFSFEDVLRFLPGSEKYKYDVIVRYIGIKEGIKKKKDVVIPENSREVFYKFFKYILSGSLNKIYYLQREFEIEGIKVINPLIDFDEKEILEIESGLYSNPYKNCDEYKTYTKIYDMVMELNPEWNKTFFKGKIKRYIKNVKIEKVKCERCGIESVTKICDFCSIREKVIRALKEEEKMKEKRKKHRRYDLYGKTRRYERRVMI